MNVHDLNHKHSPYIRALSPENATELALAEALKLQSQVFKSCDAECIAKVPISPTYPVAAALGPKRWLMDTGTPFDIVSVNDINAEAESHKVLADNNVTLNAVGGMTDVQHILPLTIRMSNRYKEKVDTLLIPTTSPAALSIGRRCMEMGYGFYWPPYGKPRLVDPNGRNIPLEVHHYCPYILDHSRVPGNSASRHVAPATTSSGSGSDPNQLDGYDPDGAQTENTAVQSTVPKSIHTVKPTLTGDASKPSKATVNSPDESAPTQAPEPEEVGGHAVATDSETPAPKAKGKAKAKGKSKHHTTAGQLTLAELHQLDHEHKEDDPDCPICKQVRVQQKNHGTASDPSRHQAKKFGDHLTGDHWIAKKEFDRGINGETCGLVLLDVGTDDLECYGCDDKSANTSFEHMNDYEGKYSKVKYFYSDESGELSKAAKLLRWPIGHSVTGIKMTNSLAENAVKRVLRGIQGCLLQAGLEDKWWPYAGRHFCWSRRAKIVDGDSIYNKKFGEHIDQRILYPLGCRVYFLPTPDAEWTKKNKHKHRPNSIPGIFLGYVLQYGGTLDQKKPVMYCAPISEFQKDNPKPPVMKTQVVIPDKTDDKYHFPLKQRFDMRRQEIIVSEGSGIPNVEEPAEETAPGSRPDSAIPMPDEAVEGHPSESVVPEQVTQKPADPNEATNTAQEHAESPNTPPTPKPSSEAEQGRAEAPHDKASVESTGDAMPKTITPDGCRRAMTVREMLQGPMNRVVYIVDGGSIVSYLGLNEFTARTKNSKKPHHITPREWQNAKSDWISKLEWQKEWNAKHPSHSVELIKIPGGTEAGKGSSAGAALGGTVTSNSESDGKPDITPVEKPDDDFPRMPRCSKPRNVHRQKITAPHRLPQFSAAVARPVRKDEFRSNPKAKASVDVEWSKLRAVGDKGCWDESKVQSKRKLLAQHRQNNTKCHWGRVFALCVEKGSELDADDPNRKFKGRVVFQGNNVKDENYDWALFAELGSSPCTMQAGKMADAIGLLDGNQVEFSDAEAAYTQAKLKGIPTFIELPKDQWPDSWHKLPYDDPVCPLIYALYGHPDSGGYWEQHCDEHVKSVGFRPLSTEGWPSCYWHSRLKCFLVVYVDDFKMAGPADGLKEAWSLLRKVGPNGTKGLKMDNPKAGDMRYLGCEHKYSRRPLPPHRNWMVEIKPREPKPPKKKKPSDEHSEADAEDAAEATSNETLHTNQVKKTFKLVEQEKPRASKCKAIEWDQSGFLKQCVDRYRELGGPRAEKLKRVDTPFVDEAKELNAEAHAGYLAPVASKILMKVLYAARMARFDLLRATAFLACYVTKWTEEHDRRLHRLMCYINSSLHIKMSGWIGDNVNDLELCVFSDADWAGEKTTYKSTTGAFTCLIGPNSFFPISALSKKQTCVSHSTPEAEIVAADTAIKNEGIPILTLWEILQNKPKHSVQGRFFEDNETGAHIMKTGRNPTMRHIGRTHGICIAWLSERFRGIAGVDRTPDFKMVLCPTEYMSADIFTKFFTVKDKWLHALRLIGHCDPQELWGKGNSVASAPAFPLEDLNEPLISKLAGQLASVSSKHRIRYWKRDFRSPTDLATRDYGKIRDKHIRSIFIMSPTKELFDVYHLRRSWHCPRKELPDGFTLWVMHTDPNVSRNERHIRKTLPTELCDVIERTGKQIPPPVAPSTPLPLSASCAAAHTSGPNAPVRPVLCVTYQPTRGGSHYKPGVMNPNNSLMALRTHHALTIHPGQQCLVALRVRLRIPGGVACYMAALPPPANAQVSNEGIITIGDPIPIDESYYGELYITVPNHSTDILRYHPGDWVAAIGCFNGPVSFAVEEGTFCSVQSRPPTAFGKGRGSGKRTFSSAGFSFDIDFNVKQLTDKRFHTVLPADSDGYSEVSVVCCTYTDGDIALAVRYPSLELCADSDDFRHRTPWVSTMAHIPTKCVSAFTSPGMSFYAFAMLRMYVHSYALSRVSRSPTHRGRLQLTAAASSVYPTASAHGDYPTRWLHEWCCGHSSLISSGSSPFSKGCGCQRTTITEDGTSQAAVDRADGFMSRPHALLWASMPCTGGCPWQSVNVTRPGGAARHRGHIRIFNRLWKNFEAIAIRAKKNNNFIAIEWPGNCRYWKLSKVLKLIKDLQLKAVSFDGCMVGLKSIVDGKPIRKPWKILTNSQEIIKQFDGLKCSGHTEHRPCAGIDTKATENYTKEFVDRLHTGWRKECAKRC